MIKIYGASDDLVEIEGASHPSEDEIDCFDQDVQIAFADGTQIKVGYPKSDLAVWWIRVEKQGTAPSKLTVCTNEDDEIYSDIFEIDSTIERVEVVPKEERP